MKTYGSVKVQRHTFMVNFWSLYSPEKSFKSTGQKAEWALEPIWLRLVLLETEDAQFPGHTKVTTLPELLNYCYGHSIMQGDLAESVYRRGCICTRTQDDTHQLTAAGFLSVQKFPLRLKISMSQNVFCTNLRASSVPYSQTATESNETYQEVLQVNT
jgi:hypothetical protein